MSLAATRFAWSLVKADAARATAAGGKPMPYQARLVLLYLADAANGDTGKAWPSVATIVEETGVPRRSVYEAFTVLADIVPSEAFGGRGGARLWSFPARFLAAVEAPADADDDDDKLSTPVREPHPSTRPKLSTPVREPHKGVREPHKRGAGAAPEPISEPTIDPRIYARELVTTAAVSPEQDFDTGGRIWRGGWRDYLDRPIADEPPGGWIPGVGLSDALADGDPSEVVDSPLRLSS